MTTLKFYGGVNEIGGNKILLKDRDTKIFLDFGMSFSLKSQYYSEPFLSPKDERSLLEFGLLPNLPGVYKFNTSKPEIDAIVLSHSHMDHSAYISFLKRDIPVYCGETTATILKAFNEMRAGFEHNIEDVEFKTFRTGDVFEVGSVEVEPIHVDHSIPGSYGLVAHTSSGAVVYTGDFRLQGTRPEMSEEFVERAKDAEPVAVITEHTNMTNAEVSSEPEVLEKISQLVRQTEGLVLADFARADIDRLRSFYTAAKRSGRLLAITLKQAYLMKKLSGDPHLQMPKLTDKNVLVFQKAKKKYADWEMEVLESGNIVDSSNVADMQSKVVLVASFYDLESLIDIEPMFGSCYILSASEPFNEEMEVDFNRLTNWLEHYGLPQYHAHVSGHIMPLQLRQVLQTMNPKKVFPIHGTHPELFSKFMRKLNGEILVVEAGKEYTL